MLVIISVEVTNIMGTGIDHAQSTTDLEIIMKVKVDTAMEVSRTLVLETETTTKVTAEEDITLAMDLVKSTMAAEDEEVTRRQGRKEAGVIITEIKTKALSGGDSNITKTISNDLSWFSINDWNISNYCLSKNILN